MKLTFFCWRSHARSSNNLSDSGDVLSALSASSAMSSTELSTLQVYKIETDKAKQLIKENGCPICFTRLAITCVCSHCHIWIKWYMYYFSRSTVDCSAKFLKPRASTCTVYSAVTSSHCCETRSYACAKWSLFNSIRDSIHYVSTSKSLNSYNVNACSRSYSSE